MRDMAENFEWNGFSVRNNVLPEDDIRPFLSDYEIAVRSLRSKGFGKLLYGPLIIVGQIPGHVYDIRESQSRSISAAALYYHDKDLIVVNGEIKPSHYVFAHEIGHRNWFRFLSKAQRSEWDNDFSNKRMLILDNKREEMLNSILQGCASKEVLKISEVNDGLKEEFKKRSSDAFKPYLNWNKFDYKKFERSVKNYESRFSLWSCLLSIVGGERESDVENYIKSLLKEKRSFYSKLKEIKEGLAVFPNEDDRWTLDRSSEIELNEALIKRASRRANNWINNLTSSFYEQKPFIEIPSGLKNKNVINEVGISEHGKSNTEEDYAEAFASFVLNKPMPEEIYDLFMRVHGFRMASVNRTKVASEIFYIANLIIG
jgi:hypothetical protein